MVLHLSRPGVRIVARPKSTSLRYPSAPTMTFSGFRSRCRIRQPCSQLPVGRVQTDKVFHDKDIVRVVGNVLNSLKKVIE